MKRASLAGVLPAFALALATGCSSSYPDQAEFDFGELPIADQAQARGLLEEVEAGWSLTVSVEAAVADLEPAAVHLEALSEQLAAETVSDLTLMVEGEPADQLQAAYATFTDKRRAVHDNFEREQAEARAELEQAREELAAERSELEENLAAIDAFVEEEREAVEAVEAEIEALEAKQAEIADSVLAALNEAIMEHELPVRPVARFDGYSWRSWEVDASRSCPSADSPLQIDARATHGVCVMVSGRPYRGGEAVNAQLDPILASGLLDYYELDETIGVTGGFRRRAPEGTLRADLADARKVLDDRLIVAENRFGTRRDLGREETLLNRRATSLDRQQQQLENQSVRSFEYSDERSALRSAEQAYGQALLAQTVAAHVQPVGDMTADHVFPLGSRDSTAILVIQTRERGLRRGMDTVLTLFRLELADAYADYDRVPIHAERDNMAFARFRGEATRDEANRRVYLALARELTR
ncbi:hypothetical protein [Thioalkalivibrio sp. ALE16]|uniref:hypothetical protein n=1 Tax=Thioalkalivibrio sp. ALE16 TaxID=1158172 RepID=UPI00037BE7AC|nr:hypothetical protein [Thioalkalivibrio sp. ALE16]